MTTTLTITDQHAGDNYVIEASPDQKFSCAPNCSKSGILTAWKRVYLEKKKMFRSGLFIAREAPAGTNQVVAQIPAGLRWRDVQLNPGARIRLMHAKRLDGIDASGFHSEEAVVMAVDRVPRRRNQRLLTLAVPLARRYDIDRSYDRTLADGVGDVVGNIAAAVFDNHTSLLKDAFAGAFVELLDLTHSVSEIPYVSIVQQPHRIANKWFEHTTVDADTLARPGNPNVKHVLADTSILDPTDGRGISLPDYGETGIYSTA